MSGTRLTELRLKHFKSYNDEVLPIEDITILTGRNSSGKSNALDGLEVLGRLLLGSPLADALDGRGTLGAVRGGSRGCAPHNSDYFELGCSVILEDSKFDYDVKVRVGNELRVTGETLYGPAYMTKSSNWKYKALYSSEGLDEETTGIAARVHSGQRGLDPFEVFRDDRLIAVQLAARGQGRTKAESSIIEGANALQSALKGVFHLDPVPHLMRHYVQVADNEMKRTAENISSVVNRMHDEDPDGFEKLVNLVQSVADDRINGISVTRTDFGDVMLALEETRGGEIQETTPAREMSDGLLRFMAIATALLSTEEELAVEESLTTDLPSSAVLLVIEEIENGLHPSQASTVLQLVTESVRDRGSQVLLTTHSPALLTAIQGRLNENVQVCYRDAETGMSRIERLTELQGYEQAMASGNLGEVISSGRLVAPEPRRESNFGDFLRILGME